MTRPDLTPEQLNLIDKDFPPEALSADNSRGFELTSIKAQYVIERLNDVFGIGGWDYIFKPVIETPEEIVMQVEIRFSESSSVAQYGSRQIVKNKKGVGRLGDAYKGAVTDGLTKCASIIGIGHNVFKGNVKVGKTTKTDKIVKDIKKEFPGAKVVKEGEEKKDIFEGLM